MCSPGYLVTESSNNYIYPYLVRKVVLMIYTRYPVTIIGPTRRIASTLIIWLSLYYLSLLPSVDL